MNDSAPSQPSNGQRRDRPIVGLLLAAGISRRFGTNKLLHEIGPDAMPMVRISLERLLPAVDEVVALVSPAQPMVSQALAGCGVRVLPVADSAAGQGHTLKAGVCATPHAAGWVIMLGDMPAIAPSTVLAVASALRQGVSLVAPACRGRRGHPVGFSSRWYEALAHCSGDQGARQLLLDHADELHAIATDDRACLVDVDTPSDLAVLADLSRHL